MAKAVFVDPNRGMNLVKVHDGGGNLYVFNIPPSLDLRMKDVLEHGQLIASKLKGVSCRRVDGTADPYYRNYLGITAMEFKESGLSEEEFGKLLSEQKKTAPAPGNETKYPPYQESEDTPDPHLTSADHFADIIKNATYLGKYHGKDAYRIGQNKQPVILVEKKCFGCPKTIPGKTPISLSAKGEFLRFQTFIPLGIAKLAKKASHRWLCKDCLEGKPPAPPPPAPIIYDTTKMKAYKGGGTFTFHEQGGKFYYKGNEITRNPTGPAGILLRTLHCEECGGLIMLKATVSYRDGAPFLVSASKPVNNDAKPIAFKAQRWKHIKCPETLSPLPEPIPASPKEVPASPKEVPASPKEVPASSKEDSTSPPAALTQETSTPPPKGVTPSQKNLFATLENMATDSSVDDKVFRGAAWMLCRTITGGDKDGDERH